MNEQEQRAMLAVCIMAAFADGIQNDVERSEVDRIFRSFENQNPALALVYQDVLLQKLRVQDLASFLSTKELRALAYEMAVCVCRADGNLTEPELKFLSELRTALTLDASPQPQPEAISGVEPNVEADSSATPPPLPGANPALDKLILNYAILTGALEIMPQSLATIAIIPLQTKMVYEIGKTFGFELGRGHVKDFLGTIGIGLSSQIVESYASKIVGGLVRTVGGRFLGAVTSQAAGSAIAFATTYAIGHVAKDYYASNRSLSTAQLKQIFASFLSDAKSMQPKFATDIAARAKNIHINDILNWSSGSPHPIS